jgi:regulatory protein
VKNVASVQKTLIRARRLAYQVLARRDRSRLEIIEKLQRCGFGSDIVTSVIKELEAKAYLNDRHFALSWAQKAVERKQLGPLALERELELKGVDQEIIQEVLQKIRHEISEEQLALRAIKKRLERVRSGGPQSLGRYLVGYLVRKGFTPEVIEKVLKHDI